MPLEDRTLFQMDQTTSAYQSIFGNFTECRQNPDLDCDLDLRLGRHYQKTSEYCAQSLRDSSGAQCQRF